MSKGRPDSGIYRRKDDLGWSYEIHHIDGNPFNNSMWRKG